MEPKTLKEALLDDGRIVEYDVMSHDKTSVKDSFYRYLGCGTIYRIDGRAVTDTGRKHFWAKEKRDGEI